MVAITLAAGQFRTTSFGSGATELQNTSSHSYTISQDAYHNTGFDPGFIAAGIRNSSAVWTLTVNGGLSSTSMGALFANGYGTVSHRIVTGLEGSIFGAEFGVFAMTRANVTNAGVIQGGTIGMMFSDFDPQNSIGTALSRLSQSVVVGTNLTFGTTDTISITNAATGLIQGGMIGVANASFAPMIITNSGEIRGGMMGLYADAVTNDDATPMAAIGTLGRLTLTNQATGVIDGGVAMAMVNNRITNAGEIYGAVEVGSFHPDDSPFVSGDRVDVNGNGLYEASEIISNLTALTLVNSGLIEGQSDYYEGYEPYAIRGSNARESLTNTGTIVGTIDLWGGNDTLAGAGTYVGNIYLGEGNDTATIAGRVTGVLHAGGQSVSNNDSDALTVTSTGRIELDVWMAGGNDTVTNQGTILGYFEYLDDDGILQDDGDVSLGSGNDVMTNSGTIGTFGNGILPRDLFKAAMDNNLQVGLAVDGGRGDDRFTNTGNVLGYIDMWEGNDTLTGGAGSEVATEARGRDTYALGAGNDVFFVNSYDADVDTIDGGAGRDVLSFDRYENTNNRGVWVDMRSAGLAYDAVANPNGTVATVNGDILRGFEQVIGSDYRDWLLGSDTADTLAGGAGADFIGGRGGKDVLWGNAGADVFQFASTDASGTSRSTRDVVMDFQDGVDEIGFYFDANTNLAGSQDFNYAGIAEGAFTRQAGQLRYLFEGGNTLLRGDINGDGRADFSIELQGRFNLTADDFFWA